MGNSASASDINSFRASLESNQLPKSTSAITYGGLLNEHYFSGPVSDLPLDVFTDTCWDAEENVGWIGCYIRSKYDGNPIRKPINLVIVLDISGSMSDTLVAPITENDLYTLPSKMDVSKRAIRNLGTILIPGDRIAIVTFHEDSTVVTDFLEVCEDLGKKISELMEDVSPGGGTILASGMQTATNLLNTFLQNNPDIGDCENRIVFFTDMCDTSEDELGPATLMGMALNNAKNCLHTSYIGVGVDFDVDVTDAITRVKGSNYFCLFSEEDFENMLNTEFNYNFFPSAFDVSLKITTSEDNIIDSIYGTNYDDEMKLVRGHWSPEKHCLYSNEFRETVLTMLLIQQSGIVPTLPLEILGMSKLLYLI
eukprot:TRINITY_DN4457_c0_g1_i1.p1 TRINITY_DN4457_c0_g1~~TRINITY_DN4457_c0_g1_i1.p1  ORF type:complete len:367 (-),score=83.18 TRINITY_DN4457_c0_g1_i1:558-1658(-)